MSNMTNSRARLKAVDLFCGCGGLAAGIRAAGFEIVAGADIESKYLSTFTHNFPQAKSLCVDLFRISVADFARTIDVRRGELDLLAGGPPCQGFSKNVPRKHRRIDDDKNALIRTFLDYCAYLMPRFVLLENVAEMKNGFERAYSDEIATRLRSIGYAVSHVVLNAADHGVPQRRRRAFFLANRDGGELLFPHVTHSPADDILGFSALPHVPVWEAIGDLPPLQHGEASDRYACEPFSDFQRFARDENPIVKNHVARLLRPTQLERLASLQPGESMKNLPAHLRTSGGYSGAYGRLTKEMIAPTITRWVFHPGSGRWGHPVDTRLLTIREVARLQSFPDNFEFIGSYIQQAGQLGNAVPVLLAQRIAENILFQSGTLMRANSPIKDSHVSLSSVVGS